ncbi:MAG: hypothetical protein ACREQL_01890, partial [Candidatus Binatia bacterium]
FSVTIARQYDGASNLTQIKNVTANDWADFTYDSLNRTATVSWFIAGVMWKTLSYGYDDAGNRVSMTE